MQNPQIIHTSGEIAGSMVQDKLTAVSQYHEQAKKYLIRLHKNARGNAEHYHRKFNHAAQRGFSALYLDKLQQIAQDFSCDALKIEAQLLKEFGYNVNTGSLAD